ncbi:MAG: tetratricopeptide repeat protein [Deltaproteobacteria bacterium]|nr:tetratricopeptide repeat protein [Deltaproteobacteria bacterium]
MTLTRWLPLPPTPDQGRSRLRNCAVVLAFVAAATACGPGYVAPDRDRGLSESPLRPGVDHEPLSGRLLDGMNAMRDTDYEAARQAFEEHLSKYPRSALAMYHLGLVAMAENKRAEARIHFEEAIAANPQLHGALSNLGILYLADDEEVAAQKVLEQAATLAPDDARVWSNLGAVRLRRGLWSEAIEALKKASELAPGHGSILYNLALAWMERQEYGEALKALDQALEMRPRFAQAWAAKVACLQGLGRVAEAEQVGREAERTLPQLGPDNRVALARVLVLQRKVDDAIEQLNKGVEQYPDDAGALLALGELLDAKGDKVAALETYQRFLKAPGRRSDDVRRIRDRCKQLGASR